MYSRSGTQLDGTDWPTLNRDARPLTDLQTKDLMRIVVAEIIQHKVSLDTSGNVKAVQDDSTLVDGARPRRFSSPDDHAWPQCFIRLRFAQQFLHEERDIAFTEQ